MKIHNAYDDEKISNIKKLFLEGYNPSEIGKMLGTYNTTIRRILIKNGFTLKNQSESQAKIPKNPFNIQDINSLYWLGFISGDGNVFKTRIKIGLQPRDSAQLSKFNNFLKSDIKLSSEYNSEGQESVVLAFKSKDTAKFLISVGITENKSKTLEVREDLMS